jgi:hypothetical protein
MPAVYSTAPAEAPMFDKRRLAANRYRLQTRGFRARSEPAFAQAFAELRQVELIERRRRDKSAGADILGRLMKARDHDCCVMTDGRGVARVGEGNLDPVVKETMA